MAETANVNVFQADIYEPTFRDRIGNFMHDRAKEALTIVSTVALTIGAVACSNGSEANNPGTTVKGTTPGTEAPASIPPTTEAGLPGTITPGDDLTIREENNQDRYDCGAPQNETWKNADGSDKPFTPDHLIDHMNAHPELAKDDYNFWINQFGEKGFSFLTDKGEDNKNHDDNKKVTAQDVPATYSTFLEKQIAAPIVTDTLALNHACKDANGNYHVFPVGVKFLPANQAHLTGLVLDKAEFDDGDRTNNNDLLDAMAAEGKTTDQLIIQEMSIDTDGDGKSDREVVEVFNKHQFCGNNELKITPPPAEQPPEDTIPPTPDQPTVPGRPTTTPKPTTPGQPTTTPKPTIPVTVPKNPDQDYNNPNTGVTSPNKGPGSGGQPGPEGTIAPPTVPATNPNTTTTRAGNNTTTTKPAGPCGPACE